MAMPQAELSIFGAHYSGFDGRLTLKTSPSASLCSFNSTLFPILHTLDWVPPP